MLTLDDNLRKTFEQTAEHLTGRVVILRFSQPGNARATGECYKSVEDGITRINVSPRLTYQQAYNVALHEIAHAKLHHGEVTITRAEYAEATQIDPRKAANPTREDEAEQLALQWLEWAHEQIKHLIRWNTTPAERAIMNMVTLKLYPG